MNSPTETKVRLVCACGFEDFERIVAKRKPDSPFVTDFVACMNCRAMYHLPVRAAAPVQSPQLATRPPLPETKRQVGPHVLQAPPIQNDSGLLKTSFGKATARGQASVTADERARFNAKVRAANVSKRKR